MAIEKEKIIAAAMELLNEAGLDQFSTRRLAERLGVQQPALYWHFRSKADLLDALNSEMLTRFHVHRLPRPGEPWDEFTFALARSFRRALLSVRDGARINAGTRPSIREFADAERQLRHYVDAGFSAEDALHISISITRYVVGYVLEEQDERERNDDDSENAWSDGDPMDQLVPFPLLSEAIKPLLVEGGTINTESVFEGGLAFMVSGMRASLAGKGKKKAAPGGAAKRSKPAAPSARPTPPRRRRA
ncbi:MAG: TetR/AcrR family transcriptional regulator C-terminal domain-containing protein [Devosia sp.]